MNLLLFRIFLWVLYRILRPVFSFYYWIMFKDLVLWDDYVYDETDTFKKENTKENLR